MVDDYAFDQVARASAATEHRWSGTTLNRSIGGITQLVGPTAGAFPPTDR